ncbi:uncharacterized protein A1O9_00848 [Exophiala aquamarina CBS 119918]|uniref:Adenosinetriphosphatase n=1 Tax=Exophiala aquamarina CBS 119918 TaxID=1182545 RepID=A0A072Q4P6_9EURO|nr:uncharacterized protein A1O9_00848 [Exophiala aquamarina CBS 119918]KEF62875.1 hypothetical protein A1O9_00848 [Exophiala aquamarina CBS 119918]
MDDSLDLSAWVGNPPKRPGSKVVSIRGSQRLASQSTKYSDASDPVTAPSESNASSDAADIPDNEDAIPSWTQAQNAESSDSDTSTQAVEQQAFYIDIPHLPDEEKEEYKYLPGHFVAEEILGQRGQARYTVRLESGEQIVLTAHQLQNLARGSELLRDFQRKPRSTRNKTRANKPPNPGLIDWTTINLFDSDPEESMASDPEAENQALDEGPDAEQDSSTTSETPARRSVRIRGLRRSGQAKQELLNSDDSDVQPRRSTRTRRLASKTTKNRRSGRPRRQMSSTKSSPEAEVPTRRSERTRVKPRLSMRERHEDDISSHEEEKVGPKIVAAKEYFARVPESDPFRKRHRQECDTCYFKGDDHAKGPLVFCQGCTNSYHKRCLGFRGTRDHLVTKVGENLFVLQCRRCIGLAHERDYSIPHQGICAECNKTGDLSKPLRNRLSTRHEQVQREENGGRDPITIVDPNTINKVSNVLFRCCQCVRAWHMHHLPERKTAHSAMEDEDENEALDDAQIAQKRFDYYHRSWTCKDCIENQHQIDALVAWKPVNIETYVPGTTVDMMPEIAKEYLVKWRAQSYFRTTWMPGLWVWGIAANSMKAAFSKKPGNQLPKMSTADAIPEDFFRIDIVFDVRYSSVVRNSTKGIDLARAKEVDTAFVKYKGLGYEDAIWEKPPAYSDTERWSDFQIAYEDYVEKMHLSIPVQGSLRRHLSQIRTQDFQSTLIKKRQPPNMTGGEMMTYQVEGLNWLLYQWFKSQNAILADEMGLGKTIQLVALFASLVHDHKCWPFLVVVPNSTVPNWRREIRKWAPSIRVVTYYGSAMARKLTHDYELFPKSKEKDDGRHQESKKRSADAKDIKAHVVITSYEAVTEEKTRKSLMRVPWQCLVVDEGQRLKSDKTQIYEMLSKFRFPFKVLLTGTPLQNNARELFNLLQFLDRSMNAAELDAKYADLTQDNVPELHEMLRKFFLRRTKAQVLTFLPPMAQIIIPVSMSTVQKKVYKSILAKNPQLMKSIFTRDSNPVGKDRVNLNNILMQLRKTLCHPFVYNREIEERTEEAELSHLNLVEASSKLKLLSLMLPKLQEGGHRVLMFSQFLDNLDIIEDFLDGLGFQHRRIDGTINSMEKQKRIDEFNAPNSPFFAFLLSTRAGGVGINLATADTVIIMDPDFNPHQDIQALSRAHRIGQQHKVLVFQLMTRDSAEEKIMQIGRKKMALDHVLIERMDREDDAGEDLVSILRHGAQALFEDESTVEDIVYDSASVDRLLERSHIENTKISDEKSAESQFSFARIWANGKGSLEDELEVKTGTSTPNPGIWDKILQDRQRIFDEEQALKTQTYGRGKRKRENVDYGMGDGENIGPARKQSRVSRGADPEYQNARDETPEEEDSSAEDTDVLERRQPTIRARPFKRIRVPLGPAPIFNGDVAYNFGHVSQMPPQYDCSACGEQHAMGWCRLKVAGVEHCGLCGLAHLGHGRTCPHLSDERRLTTLLQTLKESTESREFVEQASKYVRSIRSDLIQRRRAQERREQEAVVQGPLASAQVNDHQRLPSAVNVQHPEAL